jgi:hypothetical protein
MEKLSIPKNLRWYLAPTAIFIGLVLFLLIAPVSNAANPHTTLIGDWVPVNNNTTIIQKGQGGPLVLETDSEMTFTGGIDGVVSAPLTLVWNEANGNFSVEGRGVFVGTIDGKTGTTKIHFVVNGQDLIFGSFCCYHGPISFYGGTEELKGLTATGVLTNDFPTTGRRYSVDVISR